MIKSIVSISILLLSSVTSNVMAAPSPAVTACAPNNYSQLIGTNLATALLGNTACVAKSGGGWEWQEEHAAGGVLNDWKNGNKERVGTWSTGNTSVTYTYGPQAIYSYTVWRKNGSSPNPIYFCGQTNVIANVISTTNGCH